MKKFVCSLIALVLSAGIGYADPTLYASTGHELETLDPATGQVLSSVPFTLDPQIYHPPYVAALTWHPTLGLLALEGHGHVTVDTVDTATGRMNPIFEPNDQRPYVRYRGLAADPATGLLWITREIYDYDYIMGVFEGAYLSIGNIDTGLFADQIEWSTNALAFDNNGVLWGAGGALVPNPINPDYSLPNIIVKEQGQSVTLFALAFSPTDGTAYVLPGGFDFGTIDLATGDVTVLARLPVQHFGLTFVP